MDENNLWEECKTMLQYIHEQLVVDQMVGMFYNYLDAYVDLPASEHDKTLDDGIRSFATNEHALLDAATMNEVAMDMIYDFEEETEVELNTYLHTVKPKEYKELLLQLNTELLHKYINGMDIGPNEKEQMIVKINSILTVP